MRPRPDKLENNSACMKHLKPTTSSGPDGIPNICLKIVLVHLLYLFAISSIFPLRMESFLFAGKLLMSYLCIKRVVLVIHVIIDQFH